MKDNHSYFFNFFNKKSVSIFFEEMKKISYDLKLNEQDKTKNEKRKNSININAVINNIFGNKNKNDYNLIENPINYFEKMQYKNKYKKGEISNLDYLLLLNKFSSRTYNDNNQYLIFPLLFMNVSRTQKRDLSKCICLNRDDNNETLTRCKNNKKVLGYYFSQHYSTSGYIFYYLIRQIPFTYSNIELQSGRFDLPGRIFCSLKHHLGFLQIIQDNRELVPEFYFNYEFLLNLNHNDFGESEDNNAKYYINNFDSNNNETSIQFIIYLKKLLEEKDLSPWIDNIFGSKQFSNDDEHPNSFPLYSYESNVNYEKIIQEVKPLSKVIEKIKQNIELLRLGIIPAKIFNKNHPKIIRNMNNNELEEEKNNFDKKKEKIINKINEYINIKTKQNKDFYLINSRSDNEIELIFKFHSEIDILKFKLGETKLIEISLIAKDQIEFEPYNNLFCEIISGTYCIVRNRDKTIKFISQKRIIEEYQWTCIVTAIEPFIKNKKFEDKNIKKVFIGDEKGYLYLLEIECILNNNDKVYEIKSIQIIQSVKAQNSLIKGIIYNEKLNIIISWNDKGVISIINDYSFNFLNIIDLGNYCNIKKILISKYDLLYVNYYNIKNRLHKIICYTLNGIKATYYDGPPKIINFYVDEKINIITENRNIFNYNCFDLYDINSNLYCEYVDNVGTNKITVKFCCYYPKIKKMLIIYSDNKVNFQNIEKAFI